MDDLTTEQKKMIILDHINDKLSNYTQPVITAIVNIIDAQNGSIQGSGFHILWNSSRYIMTASHVLTETNPTYEGLAYSQGSSLPPVKIDLKHCYLTKDQLGGLDLAIIKTIGSTAKEAKLAQESNSHTDDLLFVHGYPGVRSKPLGNIYSKTMPFDTAAQEQNCVPWYNPDIHLCIAYPRNNLIQTGGSPADFEDPHGLSGSAIWKVGWNGKYSSIDDLSKWSPEEAEVIGIVHTWDEQGQCLIGTKIESIYSSLNSAEIHFKNV